MKKILLLAFTASVMLGACKKDKGNDEPETLPTCATITEGEIGSGGSLNTIILKFDEKGRVKEETNSWGSYSYEYHSNKIIATETETDAPSEKRITTYTLDNQGRVTQSVYNGETPTIYEYNNDGYLIKVTWTDNGNTSTETYIWESGNIVKIINDSFTTDVIYGSEVINDKLISSAISTDLYCPDYYLQDYFGKKFKNAPIKKQSTGSTYNYSYTKDSKANIIGYSALNANQTGWEYSVDYNCK
jgi:YD repeat-containing protein